MFEDLQLNNQIYRISSGDHREEYQILSIFCVIQTQEKHFQKGNTGSIWGHLLKMCRLQNNGEYK